MSLASETTTATPSPDVDKESTLSDYRVKSCINQLASVCEPLEHSPEEHPFHVFLQDEIWLEGVFPFLGIGYFAFVAGVNKRMKELYQSYFATIQEPQEIVVYCNEYAGWDPAGKLTVTHTLCGSAFASLSCAKLWYQITKGTEDHLGRNSCL